MYISRAAKGYGRASMSIIPRRLQQLDICGFKALHHKKTNIVISAYREYEVMRFQFLAKDLCKSNV